MTMLKERAMDMINNMPEEKLYYVVQLLESVDKLSENVEKGDKTPEQRALEDLQRFRKRSDVEIDYKAELAKAREEKYANID
ncbi:MAG: dihydrodipicolinate reductase [Lachnospiraceae bacterium]|nr:dihydrodipicolinate reductase [Lachnospiraceae bacterium]